MPLEIRCCCCCCSHDVLQRCDANGRLMRHEGFRKNANVRKQAEANDASATNGAKRTEDCKVGCNCDCSCCLRPSRTNCGQCKRKFNSKCVLLLSCNHRRCQHNHKHSIVIICACCHERDAEDLHEEDEEDEEAAIPIGADSQSDDVHETADEQNAGTERSQDANRGRPVSDNMPEADTKQSSSTDDNGTELADSEGKANALNFVIHRGLSQKGTDLLEDSAGYTYTKIRSSKQSQFWRCTARSRMDWCRATVSQRGNLFYRGAQPHTHAPEPGKIKAAELRSKIKSSAAQNLFEPATSIVYSAASQLLTDDACPQLASIGSLARAANRFRRKLRPQMPRLTSGTAGFPTHFDAR